MELCRRRQPDLVLRDGRMPELDGLAATRAIKQDAPRTSVIIVTTYENPDYLFRALKAGAAGYLLKDATRHELLTAVRRVLRGEDLLDPQLAAQLLRRLSRETVRGEWPSNLRLTPRQRQVLHLLAQGQTNREIAATLSVGVGTVKTHIERIIAGLGVSDRTQAAVRGVELGILTSLPGA